MNEEEAKTILRNNISIKLNCYKIKDCIEYAPTSTFYLQLYPHNQLFYIYEFDGGCLLANDDDFGCDPDINSIIEERSMNYEHLENDVRTFIENSEWFKTKEEAEENLVAYCKQTGYTIT